ncbi:hypothetical protein H9L39_00602 [Fusarium oxysporum f. sp. albedinis]|nr:hypothetical protein H9L39_00602 [Fusarium oxysporum f. sp. albedinis]
MTASGRLVPVIRHLKQTCCSPPHNKPGRAWQGKTANGSKAKQRWTGAVGVSGWHGAFGYK